MAKLERKVVESRKGKKRKHAAAESEDEVANKSLIIEVAEKQQQVHPDQWEQECTTKINKKRKSKHKQKEIKEKRSKNMGEDDIDHEGTEEADDGLHEPTADELHESEKPENLNAVPTVRRKKKQKHRQRLETQKEQSLDRDRHRNEEYLNKWKHARAEWKFEKLRQIAIQKSVFDEDKLGPSMWPIALEYLSSSKGAAKDKIVQLANEVIEQMDKMCEEKEDEAERQDILNSIKYQRARDLLQSFN